MNLYIHIYYVFVCMCVCVCGYIYVYMYIYIYVHMVAQFDSFCSTFYTLFADLLLVFPSFSLDYVAQCIHGI